ncbi:MAG: hypothetical protein MJZ58_03235 [Paludibacteraceae bacterium]|nr:hypothetical protein [Paludibacteraceae bacterium]
MKKRTIIGLSLVGAIILVVGIAYGIVGPQIKAARSVEQIAAVASKDFTRWTMVYNREKGTVTYYQYADFSHPITLGVK